MGPLPKPLRNPRWVMQRRLTFSPIYTTLALSSADDPKFNFLVFTFFVHVRVSFVHIWSDGVLQGQAYGMLHKGLVLINVT